MTAPRMSESGRCRRICGVADREQRLRTGDISPGRGRSAVALTLIYQSVYWFMDTRTALLRSALLLFAGRGYDCVGVQEIAESAGVAKPTLYHFFGSKQGILEAIFAERVSVLDALVSKAAVYSGDLPRTLDNIAAAYIEFATSEPAAYRLELGLYFAPRENPARSVAVRHFARRQALLEGVFMAAVKDHGNMRGRHRKYAVSLVGALNSYIALQLDGEITITDRLRRDIVHQFSHGIYS